MQNANALITDIFKPAAEAALGPPLRRTKHGYITATVAFSNEKRERHRAAPVADAQYRQSGTALDHMLAVSARLAYKTANADARRAARKDYNAYHVSIAHTIIAQHTHPQTQKVFRQ